MILHEGKGIKRKGEFILFFREVREVGPETHLAQENTLGLISPGNPTFLKISYNFLDLFHQVSGGEGFLDEESLFIQDSALKNGPVRISRHE